MQKLNNVTILHLKKNPTELYDLKVHAKKSVTIYNGGKKEDIYLLRSAQLLHSSPLVFC